MSHTLKLWERVLDSRLRDVVNISVEQFGFMKGRGTVDAICIATATRKVQGSVEESALGEGL